MAVLAQPLAVEIQLAKYQDLGDILKLQLLAYKSEGQIYDDFRIPPLLQTEEEIKTEFSEKLFLKAIDEHGIIGSVRCLSAMARALSNACGTPWPDWKGSRPEHHRRSKYRFSYCSDFQTAKQQYSLSAPLLRVVRR